MDSDAKTGLASTTEQESTVLERVLHRLVITEDAKLAQVLDKLLPKLLRKLNDAPAVRGKVIDVLSHVSKRVRPNSSIMLPCADLLEVCRDVPPTSFAFNFSLTFLDMAVPRLPTRDQGAVAASIARDISRLQRYSPSQNLLLNLFLAVLEHLPLRIGPTVGSGVVIELSREDSEVIEEWLLDVCLYPGVLTREGSSYQGLSPAALARLTAREKTWPAEVLKRCKLAALRALRSDLFSPSAAVLPAIAAACSSHHEVVKAAEDLLKSLSSADRTGTLRRSASVASGAFNLVLGADTRQVTSSVQATSLSALRSPVSVATAVRALAWLEAECPDGVAATVPLTVRVSFMALFSGDSTGDTTVPGTSHHDRANTAKFRAAGARLAAFVVARCKAEVLPMVAPLLLQAVQRVLTMNAAPAVVGGAPPSAGSTLLMQIQHTAMLEACYEAIASLAVRRPHIFAGDTSVPRLLFTELSAKDPALRVKISAALGALNTAYREANSGTVVSELRALLWTASASPEHRARLSAVEWACDLFDFSDVAARRLCVSLCDDKIMAVRNAASRGLQPSSSGDARTEYPSFGNFVLGALRDDVEPAVATSGTGDAPSISELPPAALARALDFAMECRKKSHGLGADDMEVDGTRDETEAVKVFLSLIESTLSSAPSAVDGQHGQAQMILLHRSAAVALRKLAAGEGFELDGRPLGQEGDARDVDERASALVGATGVAADFASRGPWLQQWLGHERSTEIREAFAETTGAAAEHMDPNSELVPLLRALGHKLKPCTAPGATGFSNRAVSAAHGAACAIGAIIARLAAVHKGERGATAEASPASLALNALSKDTLPAALSAVTMAIGHPVSLLHTAACGAIGRVGALGSLPLDPAKGVSVTVPPHTSEAGGERRLVSAQDAYERLWTACKLGETSDASRRAEAAAEALGSCCRGSKQGHLEHDRTAADLEIASARVRRTLRVLFDMAKNQKEEELQFAVAAAVADVARSGSVHVPAGSVLDGLRAAARAAGRKIAEIALLEGAGGDAAMASGGALVDALEFVLYQVMYVLLEDHFPPISGAAAVYLLAIVQRCKGHPVLAAYLPDVQAAFTRKLTVRSEFVQEVAGRGLSLVYEAASSESKQGLVDSLVDALSTGRRRATGAVDVHGATHAGAALSDAGAGAYGEMCAVANDVGRPDLIYSFLSMASHHAAWTTRRGASFGLGAIVSQVSAEAFGEQLGRIVPRLFRYRFDPSAKTRAAMEQLWRSVVGGGGAGSADFSTREKQIIRDNLSPIFKELLRALGDRKWRDRQSACAGLSDLLRGRSWDEIGPHLEQLWIMADRALDDIKESVAEAAVDFAKTLANVSVRLCDPYGFVPPSQGTDGADDPAATAAAAAAAAAAQSDAGAQGREALREEAGEARRAIGTMMQDLRSAEDEARARGEDAAPGQNGLATGREREAAVAAGEMLRQAVEREGQGTDDAQGNPGVGRVSGARNGPTVDDILRPGRAGSERTGPPPSAAAREAAAAAVAVVLPWLLRKGILSRCKASQALAMRTLQRLVKVCDREALMPHLAELVATLIEGLSALEPQALQYMQFHAETQLEMTQDQMERLRLSVSRAGPLQDALDQCYRHLDSSPELVEQLMPRLIGLLRSGTGLATRSASAYLVLSICQRAPMEVRRAAPRLLPTLTNTALSERSSTLRRTYSSALASVARLAPAAGVSRLAKRLAQLFRECDPDYDKRQRRTLALLLGDICRRAGAQLGASGGGGGKAERQSSGFDSSGWAQILPVAFVARHDPDKPVADAFEEAWQEGLTHLQLGAAGSGEELRVRNAKDAVLLMLPSVLRELSLAISSVSRVTKRQGCSGLQHLASTLGPALGDSSSGRRLVRRVLSQVPGRVWDGKEDLLGAVVALCKAGKGTGVTLEPLVWKEGAVSTITRGVKRYRIELAAAPAAVAEDDEEREDQDEDNDEEQDDADGAIGDEVGNQGGDRLVSGAAAADDLAADGSVGGRGEGGRGGTEALRTDITSSEGVADGSAGDERGVDGTGEPAFLYENKVGDLDGEDAAAPVFGDAAAPVVGDAATPSDEVMTPEERTAGARGDTAALETRTGSLDGEDDSPVPVGEVAALMLSQLRRKSPKYRRAAAVALTAILTAFPECCLYEMVAPTLLGLAGVEMEEQTGATVSKEDPIMQARAVSCLAAAWPRLPASEMAAPESSVQSASAKPDVEAAQREAVLEIQRAHAARLTQTLSKALRRKVWSVRVPIYHALTAVVVRSYVAPSAGDGAQTSGELAKGSGRPVLTGSLLTDVVEAVDIGAGDAKYSQVRAAAIALVVALTSRKDLRLTLTAHKEDLVGAARKGAEDTEPMVAVEGSKALQNLSWWP